MTRPFPEFPVFEHPALNRMVDGLGGLRALRALRNFVVVSRGERAEFEESYRVGELEVVSSFESVATHDVQKGRFRVDYQRDVVTPVPAVLTYAEIINGDRGYVEGADSVFGGGNQELRSSRVAVAIKHARLVHPQLIVLAALDEPSLLTVVDQERRGNRLVYEIEARDLFQPLRLVIDGATDTIERIETFEVDPIHGNVPVVVSFDDWMTSGDGVRFPGTVTISVAGYVVHREQRLRISTNVEIEEPMLELPGDGKLEPDRVDALRGAARAEWFERFLALGVPLDAPQTFVDAQLLAPGVWMLTGGSHHSLLVEQEEGLVLVEAPLDEDRGVALVGKASELVPGKSITHVINTHHHVDHSGGIRAVAATVVRLVTGVSNGQHFRDSLRASFSLAPDAIELRRVPVRVTTVEPGDRLLLDDKLNPVEAISVANTHAEGMLVAYVVKPGILFNSDLYSPGVPATPRGLIYARELQLEIKNHALDVELIVGGHGGTGMIADLDALVMSNR